MSTPVTGLGGIGWVYGSILSTGPFCLVRKHTAKPRPCRVRYGFSQSVVSDHLLNVQILNRYQAELVDYRAGVLVREIVPSPGGTLVNSRYNPTFPGPLARTLFLAGHLCPAFSFTCNQPSTNVLHRA